LVCWLQIAKFIFGDNTAAGQGSEMIAMTSPVRMEIVSGWAGGSGSVTCCCGVAIQMQMQA
jgi:hypothetical protein